MRTIRTHNGVGVATGPTGIDDRVDASVEDWYSTWQSPKRVSRRDQEESCSENRKNHREWLSKSAKAKKLE